MTLIIREAEGGLYIHMGEKGERRMNGLGEGGGDKFGDHFFVSPFRWTGCLSGLKERNPNYADFLKNNLISSYMFYNMFAT